MLISYTRNYGYSILISAVQSNYGYHCLPGVRHGAYIDFIGQVRYIFRIGVVLIYSHVFWGETCAIKH